MHKQKALLEELEARNANWFEIEIDKLDHWADDRRTSLKVELDDLNEAIKENVKAARLAPNLPEKLEKQQALRKWKPSVMKPGVITMRQAAIWKEIKISCWTR